MYERKCSFFVTFLSKKHAVWVVAGMGGGRGGVGPHAPYPPASTYVSKAYIQKRTSKGNMGKAANEKCKAYGYVCWRIQYKETV